LSALEKTSYNDTDFFVVNQLIMPIARIAFYIQSVTENG